MVARRLSIFGFLVPSSLSLSSSRATRARFGRAARCLPFFVMVPFLRPFLPKSRRRLLSSLSDADESEDDEDDEEESESEEEEESSDEDEPEEDDEDDEELLLSSSLDSESFMLEFLVFSLGPI